MSEFINVIGQNYVLGLQATAFDNEQHSDCEIHVGTQHFKVSNFVIGLHSEVFRAAFYHNTIEKQNNVIKIDDLDPVLIEKMLRYMYTGVVEDLDKIASELYVVADRYAVHSLKELCHLSLFSNLRVENILHCLELLHTFDNLKRFKPKTLQFVTNNLIQIINLPEWKEFCSDHGDILREVLEVTAAQPNNRPVNDFPPASKQMETNQNIRFNPIMPYQFNGADPMEEAADPEIQILNPPPGRFQFPTTGPTYYSQNIPYSQQPYQSQLELNSPPQNQEPMRMDRRPNQ